MTKMVTLTESVKSEIHSTVKINHLEGRHHLPAIKALDAQVHKELPEDKKNSFLHRSDFYFKSLLAGWTGALFGAWKKNKLIGKVAIQKVESWRIATMMQHITYPDPAGAACKQCGGGTIGIIQSLCVLKSYKGNGLAQDLIAAAKLWAADMRCAQLFAQVGKKNVCSSLEFCKQGFEFYAGWQGADHGRYLMRAYGNDAEPAPVLGCFAIAKEVAYPKEDRFGRLVRPSALIPLVDLHLEAGRRVRLNPAKSTASDLHFDLV